MVRARRRKRGGPLVWLRRRLDGTALELRLLLVYHEIRRCLLSRLSDEAFAVWMYRKATGKRLNLHDPRTFDEKLWWLKIYYRDPLMVECTDKIAVREYVTRMGYGQTLNDLLGAWEMVRDITWNGLPSRFYLKTSNSSGTNIRIDDKSKINIRDVEARLNLFLKRDHYALSREWNYAGIRPRLLAEPIIDEGSPGTLVDYRFLCVQGVCRGLLVDIDTADKLGNHRPDARRNVYNREFELLDVRITRPRIEGVEIARPKNFDFMLRMAEDLSSPFPFCRVDLFNIDGRVVFGELTFFHAGGCNIIEPDDYAWEMGTWIDLSQVRTIEDAGGARRYDS